MAAIEARLMEAQMATIVLAFVAAIAGFYSACYWTRSSQVKFRSRITHVHANNQPIVGKDDVDMFFNEVARLNANAARGAAVAVIFSTASAFWSAITPLN